jgi:hypothetical protein
VHWVGEVLLLTHTRGLSMQPQDNTTRSAAQEKRKYRRFNLRYPAHLKVSSELVSKVDTVSRNVSVGGLLLESPLQIPEFSSVSFVLILRSRQFDLPIELAGEGEVVRVEPLGPEAGFGIAVKCTSPMRKLESFLNPTA